MIGYYDRDGNAVDQAVGVTFFADNRVAFDKISADVEVSTVHLVIDHSHGQGPPVIFETMVFGGPHDQTCERYSTLDEAKAGHRAVVERVRGGAS